MDRRLSSLDGHQMRWSTIAMISHAGDSDTTANSCNDGRRYATACKSTDMPRLHYSDGLHCTTVQKQIFGFFLFTSRYTAQNNVCE
jgi:hypothetical protein